MKLILHQPEMLSVKQLNPLLVVIVLVLLFVAAYYVQSRFERSLAHIIQAVIFMPVVTYLYIFYRSRKLPDYDGPFPRVKGARLRAAGTRRELGLLARVEDVSFEPVVVEVMYSRALYRVGLLATIAGTLGIIMRLIFPLAMFLAWVIQRFTPTYYRIVPGRMDIMQFSFLTNRGRVLRQLDLKYGRILISFPKERVVYHLPYGPTETIWLGGIAKPYELAKAIMQGAISTSIPPPLPSNRLLN